MARMLVILTEDEFLTLYPPVVRENQSGIWEHNDTLAYPREQVWSIYENLDNGTLYALPGYRVVNIIGYIVTEKPWDYQDIEAVFMYPIDHYTDPADTSKEK